MQPWGSGSSCPSTFLPPPTTTHTQPTPHQPPPQEYAEAAKLKGLVERYSEFINFPIYMEVGWVGRGDEGDRDIYFTSVMCVVDVCVCVHVRVCTDASGAASSSTSHLHGGARGNK